MADRAVAVAAAAHAELAVAATEGGDPDGFATMPVVISFLQGYAGVVDAPVQTHTAVTAVRPANSGYEVTTTQGVWCCDSVVLASGKPEARTIRAIMREAAPRPNSPAM